jgi:hypothetical protein
MFASGSVVLWSMAGQVSAYIYEPTYN